jgi:hypothetical protein
MASVHGKTPAIVDTVNPKERQRTVTATFRREYSPRPCDAFIDDFTDAADTAANSSAPMAEGVAVRRENPNSRPVAPSKEEENVIAAATYIAM